MKKHVFFLVMVLVTMTLYYSFRTGIVMPPALWRRNWMPKGCTIPRLVNQPKTELTINPGVTSLTVVIWSIVPHVLPVDLQPWPLCAGYCMDWRLPGLLPPRALWGPKDYNAWVSTLKSAMCHSQRGWPYECAWGRFYSQSQSRRRPLRTTAPIASHLLLNVLKHQAYRRGATFSDANVSLNGKSLKANRWSIERTWQFL